jgi:hypothetical protein
MDDILTILKAFQDEHIWWAPERFMDIQDVQLRDGVRAAFRKPTEYLTGLTSKGTIEDMNAFEAALTEDVFLMKPAALAGFLDLIYKLDQQNINVSEELVQWYRQRGWKFPLFRFEMAEENPKKIDGE